VSSGPLAGAAPPANGDRSLQATFRIFANNVSEAAGSPWAFLLALAAVVVWALTGPFFHYSQTWQLTINTACSVIPTLMVFLIQNMQNRDAKAMHLKLDELIRASSQARNQLIQLEAMTDEELDALEKEFRRMRGAREK
jgi:low affinity Fe/Cu permease